MSKTLVGVLVLAAAAVPVMGMDTCTGTMYPDIPESFPFPDDPANGEDGESPVPTLDDKPPHVSNVKWGSVRLSPADKGKPDSESSSMGAYELSVASADNPIIFLDERDGYKGADILLSEPIPPNHTATVGGDASPRPRGASRSYLLEESVEVSVIPGESRETEPDTSQASPADGQLTPKSEATSPVRPVPEVSEDDQKPASPHRLTLMLFGNDAKHKNTVATDPPVTVESNGKGSNVIPNHAGLHSSRANDQDTRSEAGTGSGAIEIGTGKLSGPVLKPDSDQVKPPVKDPGKWVLKNRTKVFVKDGKVMSKFGVRGLNNCTIL